MKLMRKLEKQALARAAKEARKQQGKISLYRKLGQKRELWGGGEEGCCWSGGHFKTSLIKISQS